MNQQDLLKRYPRLIAHMMCESLGYFTVNRATDALRAHRENRPAYNEWYDHMAGCRIKREIAKYGKPLKSYEEHLQDITHETVKNAFRNRKSHSGYMAEYKQAIMLVKAELENQGCTAGMLAGWF